MSGERHQPRRFPGLHDQADAATHAGATIEPLEAAPRARAGVAGGDEGLEELDLPGGLARRRADCHRERP
jgi:hypothetical protein